MAIPTANQYLNASRRINTRIMPNYVSGQRPISPPYTTNLLGWYMADKGVLKAGGAAAANGDAINQVNDQSGNGYNLTVGAGTPIFATGLYNQLPAPRMLAFER